MVTSIPIRGTIKVMRHLVAFVLGAVVLATNTAAQTPSSTHSQHRGHGAFLAGEPRSTPGSGVTAQAGPWFLQLHGFATFGATRQGGPRGVNARFVTNMTSLAATRSIGSGLFTVRVMASAEPLMGSRGYPLLLQTGETADDLNPLRDRQHPHDLLTELAVGYRRPLDIDLVGFASVALVGSPAFGPVPFMHRASGMDLPEAPIGHHLHDGTHISHGVVTIGLVSRGALTIEASLFNGRESDPDRWAPDPVRFDSYAFRAGIALGPNWSLQASFAQLAQPDRLHPTINVSRLSTSATHNRPLSRGNWQTTLAFGRGLNLRREILLSEAQRIFPPSILAHYLGLGPPGNLPADSVYLVFPSKVQSAWLLESALAYGRSVMVGRIERVAKDELFDPLDLRHSQVFSVSKFSLGVVRQVPLGGRFSGGIGAVGSVHLLPGSIRTDYGGTPVTSQLFVRLKIG